MQSEEKIDSEALPIEPVKKFDLYEGSDFANVRKELEKVEINVE